MWVLDVVDARGVARSFHLVAGEWTVGRSKCHFSFHEDTSISREHALLRVGALSSAQLGDPSARPSLELVDRQSRFGSYVNAQPVLPSRELRHGDEVSFGAKRTVLRVRFQPFVLVASRLPRATRTRVHETCQQIGMHLVADSSRGATHCIVDQGRVVATAKVLWALVYNQPVVCAPWLFAVLTRKSLSEPLPRCEDYLPLDDHNPELAPNYLPNPKRSTLYQRHVVVFLAPQPMEALIAAMGGLVVPAYVNADDDDDVLLKHIESKAAGRVVLVVDASHSSGMSTTTAGQTDSKDQEFSQAVMIERRVSLFQALGTAFTSVQELAASVIFAKTPVVTSDISFSNSLASHMGSSVQMMSFPEHLSLQQSSTAAEPDEDDIQTAVSVVKEERPHEMKETRDRKPVKDSLRQEVIVASRGEVTAKTEADSQSNNIMEMLAPAAAHEDHTTLAIKPRPPTPPPFEQGKSMSAFEQHCDNGSDTLLSSTDPVSTMDTIVRAPSSALTRPTDVAMESRQAVYSAWHSRDQIRARPAPAAPDDGEEVVYKPLVELCSLVVKQQTQAPQVSASSRTGDVNFKRFRKGNGYSSVSRASLFPRPTVISVTINNPEREELEENLAAQEEQERIADDLFAMAEGRKQRKLF